MMRRRKSEIEALNESAYNIKIKNPHLTIAEISKRFSLSSQNLMTYIKKKDEDLYNRIKKEKAGPKWIKFKLIGHKPKTDIWSVVAKEGEFVLGHVKWHSPWKKYTFFPLDQTLFEKDCLRDIAQFLEVETEKQKNGHEKQ